MSWSQLIIFCLILLKVNSGRVLQKIFCKTEYCRNNQQAVFTFLNHIYHGINNNLNTLAVYVDFKEAFDTVNHSILLNLSDKVLSLFSSYLSDCKQIVKANKLLSDEKSIATGVPQGSTLGPLLFIIYIDDLSNLSISTSIPQGNP